MEGDDKGGDVESGQGSHKGTGVVTYSPGELFILFYYSHAANKRAMASRSQQDTWIQRSYIQRAALEVRAQ